VACLWDVFVFFLDLLVLLEYYYIEPSKKVEKNMKKKSLLMNLENKPKRGKAISTYLYLAKQRPIFQYIAKLQYQRTCTLSLSFFR
jgi:hypothetical protein